MNFGVLVEVCISCGGSASTASSDPAGGSTGSYDPVMMGGGGGGPVVDDSMRSRRESPARRPPRGGAAPSVASSSAAVAARGGQQPEEPAVPSEAERMADLRAILPDATDEELRGILRENDRASENTRRSAIDSRMAHAASSATAAASREDSVRSSGSGPSARGSMLSRGNSTGGGSTRGSRRSWVPCQPAPSRPGVFSVGGPIETGGTYNVGRTDEMELEIKRIEAVSHVQEALNQKLGYDLRESGRYEEMDRMYKEGERMLASTGLQRQRVRPSMVAWDAPPESKNAMMKKEPKLPAAGEPLPLPLAFGAHEDNGSMQNGGSGNSEICLGKFVDPGPDEDEDEMKREESSTGSWNAISVDSTPMGPYDQIVRCWKCRAGLRVHLEVGLVACPRCRTISPATDIANIG